MIDDILQEKKNDGEQKKSSFFQIILISALAGLLAGAFGSQINLRALFSPPLLQKKSDAVSDKIPVDGKKIERQENAATVAVVKQASPSVVSVVISKDLSKLTTGRAERSPLDDFFGFGFPFESPFFSPRELSPKKEEVRKGKQRVGGGSGFLISSDGMILTNKHVVSDEDAEYTVVTHEGKEFEAKVLAKDPVNDLAILKISAGGLTPLPLGDSDAISIGETTIAIGNTLGEYRNTVTRGVISGINRVVAATDSTGFTEVIQEAIQTDAAINVGNSGGPLLNLDGEVIGINTAVNREGQSIGFALPINAAKRSVKSVQKHGRIIRPWLGVRYVLVDEELMKKNNLSVSYGALIIGNAERKELGIIAGSPAARAGLAEGDIILEVDGKKISQEHALVNAIGAHAPGDIIDLKILSKGAEKKIRVTLEEFKELKEKK